MRLLSVGGGSGGHVTPVLAVIDELSKLDHDLVAEFVCDKGFETQSRGKMQQALIDVPVTVISAGKLRRYHGESFITRLLDVKTNLSNFKDIVKIIAGFFQSVTLIRRFKPDVVFAKGGFVCLPVGLAAKVLGVPMVIHDSDTRPGLTNRVLSRFASRIATGSPLENYPYPVSKTTYTGVPIDPQFHPVSLQEQQHAKEALAVDPQKPLLVITGGGLGSRTINQAVVSAAPELLKNDFALYHVTGASHVAEVTSQAPKHPDYRIVGFVYDDIVSVLAAADVVVSRASATFLQELAALRKPVIVIPASQLSDQVKNAEVYKAAGAALVRSDEELLHDGELFGLIMSLYSDKKITDTMSQNLHTFAKPDAARDVAGLILQVHEDAKS